MLSYIQISNLLIFVFKIYKIFKLTKFEVLSLVKNLDTESFKFEIHKQFLKDFQKVMGKNKSIKRLEYLFTALSYLAQDKNLPKNFQNHSLNGKFKDIKEFHIGGDLIILYRIEKREGKKNIQLLRIGTHNYIFK